MDHIGVHKSIETLVGTIHMDTIVMTWITMAFVLLFAILSVRGLKLIPGAWQSCLEMVVEWLDGQVSETLGPRGQFLKSFIICLFLFLLVSNWLGLIPGFTSPTADINTTMGLALLVIVMVHILGVYYKGTKYIKHFFEPYFPFVIINIIEEIAKPITLAFRLFGNILAGEVMILVLVALVPKAVIPSVIWLGFSLFVGVIQAVVFTMLTIAYLANALAEDDH